MRQRRPRGSIYVIADPERLGRLIARAVDEEHEGNLKAAAEELGIDVPLLWRLRRGERSGLSTLTAIRLERLVGSARRDELFAALRPPGTYERLGRYDQWEQAVLNGLYAGAVPEHELGPLLRRVKGLFPTESERLDAAALAARELGLPTSVAIRSKIAWLRITLPLLARESSGGVELSWREFPERDWKKGGRLYAYFKQALRLEIALLERDPMVRASAAASKAIPLKRRPSRREVA